MINHNYISMINDDYNVSLYYHCDKNDHHDEYDENNDDTTKHPCFGSAFGLSQVGFAKFRPQLLKQLGHRHPDTVPWRPNVGYEPQIRIISGFHIPSGYD